MQLQEQALAGRKRSVRTLLEALQHQCSSRSMAERSAAQTEEPETEHPPPQHDAVARSAAAQLVSGAINAAKASALEDADLAASLRICTLDGVAADDDADGLLARLAALSVSAALFVTVDGEETRIDSEEALFAALRAAAQSSQPPAFRTEARPAKRRRDDSDDDAADATKRRRPHFLNVSSSGIVVASPGVFEAAAAGESVAVKVFDESSDVHVGTTCGTCKMSPIRGVRYTRPAPGGGDLDLCEPCLLAYRTGPARGERRLPFKRVPHPVREVAL